MINLPGPQTCQMWDGPSFYISAERIRYLKNIVGLIIKIINAHTWAKQNQPFTPSPESHNPSVALGLSLFRQVHCEGSLAVNKYLSHHITSYSIHWSLFKTTLNVDALYSETKEKNSVTITIYMDRFKRCNGRNIKESFLWKSQRYIVLLMSL